MADGAAAGAAGAGAAAATAERKVDRLGLQVQQLFEQWMERFFDLEEVAKWPEDEQSWAKFYRDQFQFLADHSTGDSIYSTIKVDYIHVLSGDEELARAIQDKYYRVEPYLVQALSTVYAKHNPATIIEVGRGDIVRERKIWMAFFNLPRTHKIRDLSAQSIGCLQTISGTVTRTTQVRPELLQGRFACLDCGTHSELVEQQFKYTEPVKCPNPACTNRQRWSLLAHLSVFCDWQKVKVQENADEIPSGSMPRTLDVFLRNDAVEMAKPGDKCVLVGCLVAVPEVAKIFGGVDRREVLRATGVRAETDGRPEAVNPAEGVTGLKALGVRDCSYRLCFMASTVHPFTETNPQRIMRREKALSADDEFTPEEEARIDAMRRDPHLIHNLQQNIAPNVWGHEDIKTGILLLLIGGVHKTTPEGISLRGDLNLCIVGDPSVAKSQFLKYVQKLVPRCIYTSGKASSAAGLTASVIRDVETREFTIEAGALMLADNGICCIDEFDKMDNEDQVAIHEAMEQQTISIAKAGIKATLNARTSILAAANPIGGRYDSRKPLRNNVAMTPPIMSRFDLFFVVLDESTVEHDYKLADHIVLLHQGGEEAIRTPYTSEDFLLYRRKARTLNPVLTPPSIELLVAQYRDMRQHDKTMKDSSYRITPRQLESMIRLSEAVARLYMSDEVLPQHVKQALAVMRSSFQRVDQGSLHFFVPTDAVDRDQAGQKAAEMAYPYRKYLQVRGMLLAELARADQKTGLHQGALVRWYLDTIGELEETTVLQERRIVEDVIVRLIGETAIILSDHNEDPMERVLVVNPNLPEEQF